MGTPTRAKPATGAISHLPLALTASRGLLAPAVIWLALLHPSRAALGGCVVAAFASDVFDGVIARRLGVATPTLRRLDSLADTVFYLAALFAAWNLYRPAVAEHVVALAVLGTLEAARYVFDWVKFRREASYHMWSSKLWGIALFAGFFALLGLGSSGYAMTAAIYLGIAADVEGLAISVVLSDWQSDVPSIVHAWRSRHAGRAV